jgi:hypothetical protein
MKEFLVTFRDKAGSLRSSYIYAVDHKEALSRAWSFTTYATSYYSAVLRIVEVGEVRSEESRLDNGYEGYSFSIAELGDANEDESDHNGLFRDDGTVHYGNAIPF